MKRHDRPADGHVRGRVVSGGPWRPEYWRRVRASFAGLRGAAKPGGGSPPADPDEIAIAAVEPAAFQPLLRSWFADRQGQACPPVAAINPFQVPGLAPNVMLLEPVGDSFAYRVVGDELRQLVGRDLRGMTVRDLYGRAAYGALIEAHYRTAMAARAPVHLTDHYRRPADGLTLPTWRIVMPYAEGDKVVRLLAFQTFASSDPASPGHSGDTADGRGAAPGRRMCRIAEPAD